MCLFAKLTVESQFQFEVITLFTCNVKEGFSLSSRNPTASNYAKFPAIEYPKLPSAQGLLKLVGKKVIGIICMTTRMKTIFFFPLMVMYSCLFLGVQCNILYGLHGLELWFG